MSDRATNQPASNSGVGASPEAAAAPSSGPPSNGTPQAIPSLDSEKIEPPVDYKKLWNLDESHYLIMASKAYAVWLGKDNNLDWQTLDAFDVLLSTKVPIEDLNAIYNTVAVLKAYPIGHLDANIQKTFRIMIGEGLARVFEIAPTSASQMLERAREFIVARSQELARVWYLRATGIATAFPAAFLLFGWINRVRFAEYVGDNTSYLLLGCCAGGLGAFLSILTRVGSTPLDPAAGQLLHCLEGVGRITVGILGAAIVQLAVKVGWLLPMLAERGHGGMFLVAIVAGASERLVPTLISRVEMDGATQVKAVPVAH